MEITKIKVTKAKALEIMDYYGLNPIDDPARPYEFFQSSMIDGIQIKGYRTKNPDVFTITFVGGEGKTTMEAGIFVDKDQMTVTSPQGYEDSSEQIGSDEVGVGDFFGPMIVTACYFIPSQMPILEELGVKDSKKMTDAKIYGIGKTLRGKIKHFTISCSPAKLSSYADKGFSTHWVLAHLHNLAHQRLIEKYSLSDEIVVYVDQFEPEPIYRKYLGESIVQNPMIFKTKGESHYPSVAAASVISRYEFLLSWEAMEKELGMSIPKGAGADVDKTYKKLLDSKDPNLVNKYVKRMFRNYKSLNEK